MNPEKLLFASVCSGIESASIAWEPLGMTPMWFSEIEAFPSAVLSHYWPHVYNWGDFTKIPAHLMRGHADILVGGTPCQAFSVAGKRGSLDDERGNLTLEFCKLADSLRPRIVVWENVPGVLTTSDNAFGCVLAKLCGNDQPALPTDYPTEQEINLNAKVPKVVGLKSKYWRWDKGRTELVPKWPPCGAASGPNRRVAWRVLDAQYFGVAQRRRRVFVVASDRTTRHGGKTGVGSGNGFGLGLPSDPMFTLTTGDIHAVFTGARVRRLTPEECERLQGFPRGYTSVPYQGKDALDGPRYKAIGNSKAVPVLRWVGHRIIKHLKGRA